MNEDVLDLNETSRWKVADRFCCGGCPTPVTRVVCDPNGIDYVWRSSRGVFEESAPRRRDLVIDVPIVPDLPERVLKIIEGKPGRFDMNDWHVDAKTGLVAGYDRGLPISCDTVHCLAGWFIHLGGGDGYRLEAALSPSMAGAMIFAASCPGEPIPDFYASNDDALENLRALVARRAIRRETEAKE